MSHPSGIRAAARRPRPPVAAAPAAHRQDLSPLTAFVAHQYDDFQLLLEKNT